MFTTETPRCQKIIEFWNGYALSICNGFGTYCDLHDKPANYFYGRRVIQSEFAEVAVLHNGEICYKAPCMNGDVIPYVSLEKLNDIIEEVSNYKENQYD